MKVVSNMEPNLVSRNLIDRIDRLLDLVPKRERMRLVSRDLICLSGRSSKHDSKNPDT